MQARAATARGVRIGFADPTEDADALPAALHTSLPALMWLPACTLRRDPTFGGLRFEFESGRPTDSEAERARQQANAQAEIGPDRFGRGPGVMVCSLDRSDWVRRRCAFQS